MNLDFEKSEVSGAFLSATQHIATMKKEMLKHFISDRLEQEIGENSVGTKNDFCSVLQFSRNRITNPCGPAFRNH